MSMSQQTLWPPLTVTLIAQGLLAHQLQQWPKSELRDQLESNFLMQKMHEAKHEVNQAFRKHKPGKKKHVKHI